MVLLGISSCGITMRLRAQGSGLEHPLKFVGRIRNQLLLDTHRENGSALHYQLAHDSWPARYRAGRLRFRSRVFEVADSVEMRIWVSKRGGVTKFLRPVTPSWRKLMG